MSGGENKNDETPDSPELIPTEQALVNATKLLIWKIVRSTIVGPDELLITAKALWVLERLPELTQGISVSLVLTGPSTTIGDQDIRRSWRVEVGDYYIEITSTTSYYTHGYDTELVADVSWRFTPYSDSEENWQDYVGQSWIMDDAESYRMEIEQIDLNEPEWSLDGYDYISNAKDDENSIENQKEQDTRNDMTDDISFQHLIDLIHAGSEQAARMGQYNKMLQRMPDLFAEIEMIAERMESLGLSGWGILRRSPRLREVFKYYDAWKDAQAGDQPGQPLIFRIAASPIFDQIGALEKLGSKLGRQKRKIELVLMDQTLRLSCGPLAITIPAQFDEGGRRMVTRGFVNLLLDAIKHDELIYCEVWEDAYRMNGMSYRPPRPPDAK